MLDLTRREQRLARRRRARRRQGMAALAAVLLLVLGFGAAELVRRTAGPAETVGVVPEPSPAPTTQAAPTQAAPTPSPTVTATTASAQTPRSSPARTPTSSAAPSAVDCYAVRDAGGGPIRRGERGYAAHLDSDGDGVACEYLPRR